MKSLYFKGKIVVVDTEKQVQKAVEYLSAQKLIGFDTETQFTNKFPEKFPENETQRKIVEMMSANPKVSRDTIAAEIGITTRGVQKSINALKDLGLIKRVGAAKGGHWVVNTK